MLAYAACRVLPAGGSRPQRRYDAVTAAGPAHAGPAAELCGDLCLNCANGDSGNASSAGRVHGCRLTMRHGPVLARVGGARPCPRQRMTTVPVARS